MHAIVLKASASGVVAPAFTGFPVTVSLTDIGFPVLLLSDLDALLENLWSTSFDQSVGMESISSLCWLFLASWLLVGNSPEHELCSDAHLLKCASRTPSRRIKYDCTMAAPPFINANLENTYKQISMNIHRDVSPYTANV
jgi:hypothetical protein